MRKKSKRTSKKSVKGRQASGQKITEGRASKKQHSTFHLWPEEFIDGVEPARIDYALGATINLGNYETARVSVGISVPVRIEDIDKKFPAVKAYVEQKMREEVMTVRVLERALGDTNG